MYRRKSLMVLVFIPLFLIMLTGCSDGTETDSSGRAQTENGRQNGDNGKDGADETMEPVTLSFADFFPNTHQASIHISQAWAAEVEKATNGLVKVEIYPAGTLLGDTDIYEGVIAGIADVGHSAIGYNLGRFPLLNALYLGGIEYKNSKVSSYVARDIVQEFNPAELQDTQLMFVYGLSPGGIYSKRPVRTLEDMKGLQVRASGTQIDTLELLGATPVGMSMGESYEALAKGVIDANLGPAEVLEGWNIAEVIDYITPLPFVYNAVHYVTMNKEVWQSFPPSIQKAIEEVNEKIFTETASSLWDQLNASGMKYATENFDVEVIEISEKEYARWLERLKPLQETYVQKMEEQGLPGREVIQRILELTDQYNNQFQ